MTRARSIALVLLLAGAPVALAQADETAPHPQAQLAQAELVAQSEPALVMRELLVLQTDRYDNIANNPKLIQTTLFSPIPHKSRAKRVDANGDYAFVPMPLGLITFQGQIDEPMKLRLTLDDPRDRFHGHWPADTIQNNRFLEWQDLGTTAARRQTIPFPERNDWLSTLRASDNRTWFQSRDGLSKERFILYDPSIHFTSAISLSSTNAYYQASNAHPDQAPPPLCVLIRKTESGWSSDTIAAPWPSKTVVIASKKSGADSATTLVQALAPVAERLTSRGYNEQEIELALAMTGSTGFDNSSMSLVYILPDGVIDEHIRLQVKPMPDQIIRTAIVVVKNVNPDLSSVINALLDDLGSDQWAKRDQAQRELITLGKAAIKKVQQLESNKDPEIAFRARLILEAYDLKIEQGK